MIKAIIVDDEPAARRLLHHLCTNVENIQVIGEAANGKAAIDLINNLKPDVVFLDIQMPYITGLEVLEKIEYQPNIIFTTAYEHYALKAFESFAVDYLLKPIKEERFASSIEKLKEFGKINKTIDIRELQKMIGELKPKPSLNALPVKTGDRILLIDFDSLAYLEANDKYVNAFSIEGNKYLIDYTLSQLEEKLPDPFLRVQKSFIINKNLVKEVHKHFNSRFVLILNDKKTTRITTGLTYFDKVRTHFGL
jgi:two-component system LytT family response regulator